MASIRRTLSPVPRPGISMNGEACSVASPLSKSSSSNQNYSPSGGLSSPYSSFDHALHKVQTSRPLERPKLKSQVWRRAIFHFVICFLVGVFVGLTSSVPMNLSIISKHQHIFFDPPQREIKLDGVVLKSVDDNSTVISHVIDGELKSVVNNSIVVSPMINGEQGNGTYDRTAVTQSSYQGSNTLFHKLLIIVTPTYARPFQAYYLNRLAHTLKLAPPPLLWIVVEMNSQSVETADTLRRTGVMYRHLVCSKNLTEIKDRSVHQRNVALSHIETHRLDGIVYFADDANIYSTELFEQMRRIRRFATWMVAKPVPGERQALLEGPICIGTQVLGWHTNDVRRKFRRFHAEMSGFAFNSTILWDPKRWHRPTLETIRQLDIVEGGFQVSTFIEQVVEDECQMEGVPQDCSKVMVWQLQIESLYSYPLEWLMKNNLDKIAPLASKFW